MSLVKQIKFTSDATSAYPEGSAYIIWTPITAGSQDIDIPYVDLVPVEETRPIHISYCVASQKYFGAHWMSYDVLIESPAESGEWKATLAKVKDNFAPPHVPYTQPIILSSGDALCLKANCSVESDTPGQLTVGLIYRVGP